MVAKLRAPASAPSAAPAASRGAPRWAPPAWRCAQQSGEGGYRSFHPDTRELQEIACGSRLLRNTPQTPGIMTTTLSSRPSVGHVLVLVVDLPTRARLATETSAAAPRAEIRRRRRRGAGKLSEPLEIAEPPAAAATEASAGADEPRAAARRGRRPPRHRRARKRGRRGADRAVFRRSSTCPAGSPSGRASRPGLAAANEDDAAGAGPAQRREPRRRCSRTCSSRRAGRLWPRPPRRGAPAVGTGEMTAVDDDDGGGAPSRAGARADDARGRDDTAAPRATRAAARVRVAARRRRLAAAAAVAARARRRGEACRGARQSYPAPRSSSGRST